MQARLERTPEAMTIRRQTVEHPFGTIKAWMGSTHFLMKTLEKVETGCRVPAEGAGSLTPRARRGCTRARATIPDNPEIAFSHGLGQTEPLSVAV